MEPNSADLGHDSEGTPWARLSSGHDVGRARNLNRLPLGGRQVKRTTPRSIRMWVKSPWGGRPYKPKCVTRGTGQTTSGNRPSHTHCPNDARPHRDGAVPVPCSAPRAPGRHVGDVGHPKPVRRIGLELAFDPVRHRTMTRRHARGAHASASAHPGQARLAHQTSYPFAAHPAPVGRQLGMHPRRPAPRRCHESPRG